ncbi:MAB_1171c family putative transporter [Catenulispora pinisilvae]|uniref:MAB_1171c family putative transporter n=1 Tax=Catenulispora pinisilvae TaxID=2705253 RepID=UPI0018910B82|nr:MAB_1171c family putative transporter [Catenulispora pinisilvae]
MNTTLYPLAALFAWAVVLSSAKRFSAILKEPARLAAWFLYLSFALIFTAGWSEVWNRTDAWTGLPESNTLITMCLVVCYSASQLALLQLWSYGPDRARRRIKATISIVAVVLTAMITLFVHSDSTHHLQQSFKDWYGGSVEYEAYLFIYLATYTTAEVEVIRLCRRYAKVMSPSWLRTGLTTASIGAAIGLFYSITRLADIAAALADVDISPLENVAEVGAGLGALLVMIGLTLHWWGPRISALAQRSRRLMAYIRLRPLWASFYTLDSSIAFDAPRSLGSGSVLNRVRTAARVLSDVEYHVARRVVEIRDGILTLRPYQDTAHSELLRACLAGHGLAGDELDAAVTAQQIHGALDAREAAVARDRPVSPTVGNSPADLDAELAWLLKVTKHFVKHTASRREIADTDLTPTGGIA